jgi:SNF2 family DNA or RNA helicase
MSQLDPVQIAAIEFANGRPGIGWFMEQGLGKSLTALAEFRFLYDLGDADRAIIVCPNTFKRGWLDEVQKHQFQYDVHLFRSVKKAQAAEWLNTQHELPPVLIINYEAARMANVMAALVKWASRGKCYLVIDESIQIKGNKSIQTKMVHQIASWSKYTEEPIACRFVRLLTGRPQTQGPHDLWGQLRAIGLFKDVSYYTFRNDFCQMGGWENKQVMGAKNIEFLTDIMAPFVFQAKKKNWLPELPRKDSTIRDYRMSREQQRQYDQMEAQFLLDIESGTVTVEVAIAKYEKLAQIQTGFIYDEEGVTHELVDPSENPRIQLLLQILEEEVEGKSVVVYRHKAILPALIRALASYDCAWIKGGMKPDDVAEQKDRFNKDLHCRILLAQAEATKYGHTLLGGPGEDDRCRTMIFFENSYSADTRDQIEDRIHRRGQTGEAVLYIDFSGSDLDRKIVQALQRKDELYRSVFKNLKVAEPA